MDSLQEELDVDMRERIAWAVGHEERGSGRVARSGGQAVSGQVPGLGLGGQLGQAGQAGGVDLSPKAREDHFGWPR